MVPGLGLLSTDPAHVLATAGWDLDDLSVGDLSDMRNLTNGRVLAT